MNPTNYLIETVSLNVKDLNTMSEFYQEILGLEVLNATDTSVHLGIARTKTELLVLETTTLPDQLSSGLYHVAYLVPTRQALGEFLHHVIAKKYPLQGASDHGYSEAIYLADPEGNGIEVYRDKPTSEWEYRENGIIVGVTEPMDADGVLAAAQQTFSLLTPGTIVGHVHLAVSSIQPTTDFFLNILDFTLTSQFANHAAFYGKDGYHHQFAGNIWQTQNFPANQDLTPGLNEIKVSVSQQVMDETLASLKSQAWAYELADDQLVFHDPNGIKFRYILK